MTGKLAAVKILNLHPAFSSRASALATVGDKAEKMMLTAEREIAVMKVRLPFPYSSELVLTTRRTQLLDHPNIMGLYDVWSSDTELYLVLEYIQGGELFDFLCSRGSRLHLLEAVSIIKQVRCILLQLVFGLRCVDRRFFVVWTIATASTSVIET